MNNFQGEEEEKKDQPEKDKEHEKGHEKEQDTSHGDHKKKTSEERRHHHGKHAKHLAPGESSGQRVRNYRKNDQKCYLLEDNFLSLDQLINHFVKVKLNRAVFVIQCWPAENNPHLRIE